MKGGAITDRVRVDALRLALAFGRKNLGRVKNQTLTWKELRDKLATPAIGNETLKEYLAMPKPQQDEIKNVGFFIGAHCDNGRRAATSIHERSLVTFDIDDGTPELIDTLEMGLSELCRYEFYIYPTRKHRPSKPRVRVVLPLAKPIEAEAYDALARILAAKLDTTVKASMDAVDDVSFRLAQMMYLPSRCKDGQWFTIHNKGELIDAKAVLEAFGDWHDYTKLPFSEKQGQKRLTDPSRKAENPTEKRGIIGAFCRQFDVPAAIDTFLSDVYTPGDDASSKPRYTYIGGSTSNGAIVEDDGLFLYSHHSTDPCTDRLVNAWDLVRIHKFGHLDKDVEDGAKPGDVPSFEAMVEFAEGIEEVKRELAQANYDLAAMFEDFGDEEPEEEADEIEDLLGGSAGDDIDDLIGGPSTPAPKKHKVDPNWLKQLEISKDGEIKNTVANVAQIVLNDPRLNGTIQYNEFTQELVTRKPLRSKISYLPPQSIQDPVNGDLWQDHHDRMVRVILESARGKGKPGYGLKVSDRDLTAAVDLAGRNNACHPVKEFFEGLKWDGKKRIDTLLVEYLADEDNAYTREAARLMMVAAVARVYEPGHKFDFMVIVEGLQGKRKSTFFSVLAAHWFAEMETGFDDSKKAVETMHGALIVEVAELSKFGRNEVEEIKAFVSRQKDKVRLSYERREKEFPRQCIFVGTTNRRAYLRDDTGNRRFWPIECRLAEGVEIDTDRLATEVPQLWAEAVSLYRSMRSTQPRGALPLMLTDPEAKAIALLRQDSRRIETEEDGMVGQIEAWLDEPVDPEFLERSRGVADKFEDLDDLLGPSTVRRDVTCGLEIWVECIGGTLESYGRSSQLKLSRALERISGWKKVGLGYTKKYGRQRLYHRVG